MPKVRVAQFGTIGKSILIDTDLGPRIDAVEASLAALAAKSVSAHRNLSGLTTGDDHPQYTMWQGAEDIKAVWNFTGVPTIGGITLPEYIQDTIGGILTDTASIDLVYNDGANTITANIIDEYVQDVIGAMLVDSSSVDFTYSDIAGTFTATVITANPSGLIGMSAVNGSAATPLRSDGHPAIDPAIAPTWTATHTFNNTPVVPNDSWVYAKLQNVSATSRVLGRITAGAGDIEELSAANLATIIGTSLGANPSASVGLAAVNGSAGTYMRSDGAPALSVAIVPTWTGEHKFSGTLTGASFTSLNGISVSLSGGTDPVFWFRRNGSAVDEKNWAMYEQAASFAFYAYDDTGGSPKAAFLFTRTANAISTVEFGNTTDNPRVFFQGTGSATFGGEVITPASIAGAASLRLPHGTAPSAPVNGDMWTTTAGLFVRINGATVGPLT